MEGDFTWRGEGGDGKDGCRFNERVASHYCTCQFVAISSVNACLWCVVCVCRRVGNKQLVAHDVQMNRFWVDSKAAMRWRQIVCTGKDWCLLNYAPPSDRDTCSFYSFHRFPSHSTAVILLHTCAGKDAGFILLPLVFFIAAVLECFAPWR